MPTTVWSALSRSTSGECIPPPRDPQEPGIETPKSPGTMQDKEILNPHPQEFWCIVSRNVWCSITNHQELKQANLADRRYTHPPATYHAPRIRISTVARSAFSSPTSRTTMTRLRHLRSLHGWSRQFFTSMNLRRTRLHVSSSFQADPCRWKSRTIVGPFFFFKRT